VAVAALCATCTLGGAEVSERTGFSPSRILTRQSALDRAEDAAREGDGETAIAQLNRVALRSEKMSAQELDELIRVTEQIARTLEPNQPDTADQARAYVKLFRWQREHPIAPER